MLLLCAFCVLVLTLCIILSVRKKNPRLRGQPKLAEEIVKNCLSLPVSSVQFTPPSGESNRLAAVTTPYAKLLINVFLLNAITFLSYYLVVISSLVFSILSCITRIFK